MLMVGKREGCGDVGASPVEIGYDSVGCCVLSLTRDGLAQVSKIRRGGIQTGQLFVGCGEGIIRIISYFV